METVSPAGNVVERRSESRREVDQECTVSFISSRPRGIHRLMILNETSKSMSFLIRGDSDIMSEMSVGDAVGMLYCLPHRFSCYVYRNTIVRHITKKEKGPFSGYCLVGMETKKRLG
jgi:hypothetical protein